jgi:hypothetical protein
MTEQTFLLKVSSDDLEQTWRATLTDAVTLEKQYFSSLEEIEAVFLQLLDPKPFEDKDRSNP